MHFFLCIGQFQEFFVQEIDVIAGELMAQVFEAIGQCTPAAAGGEHNFGAVGTHFFGGDNFVVSFRKPS